MERRKVIATTGVALSLPFAGCLSAVTDDEDDTIEDDVANTDDTPTIDDTLAVDETDTTDKTPPTEETSPTDETQDFKMRLERQDGGHSTATRERVIIRNVSGENQRVSGFTLKYSSGFEYRLAGGASGHLTLEPGSRVDVVSQGTGDGVRTSDPPQFVRDAGLPELVLEDGKETVQLCNLDGELVAEATFNVTDEIDVL